MNIVMSNSLVDLMYTFSCNIYIVYMHDQMHCTCVCIHVQIIHVFIRTCNFKDLDHCTKTVNKEQSVIMSTHTLVMAIVLIDVYIGSIILIALCKMIDVASSYLVRGMHGRMHPN